MKFDREVSPDKATVRPQAYDWVAEFDKLTQDEKQTWVTVGRGKLRGLLIYALELARKRRKK